MARPTKFRQVCSLPDSNRFGPLDVNVSEDHFITLHIDEYETIRLIDLEGFTQAECAQQMNVARTTVTAIYSRARLKLAKSLVLNKTLHIKGGEYQLCDGLGEGCGKGCVHNRQRQGQNRRKNRRRGSGLGLRQSQDNEN